MGSPAQGVRKERRLLLVLWIVDLLGSLKAAEGWKCGRLRDLLDIHYYDAS